MTQPLYYAGIGSRATPRLILDLMERIGKQAAEEEMILRSGHAHGADMAFERGCIQANGRKEIFLPWDGFNGAYGDTHKGYYAHIHNRAYSIAAAHHPAWDKLSVGAKNLMARNVQQIFGLDLNTPVKLVICWTPNGEPVGGTGMAIRLAQTNNITVVNLANTSQRAMIEREM